MSQPRNVTPGHEDEPPPPSYVFPNSGPGQRPGPPPEWRMWAWTSDRDRSVPWLGLLLVMVGAGLLIEYFVPSISFTTLVLVAIDVALFAAVAMGGVRFALVPALLIGAVVIARLLEELHIYTGQETTAFALAAAFLLIWVLGEMREPRRRSNLPLWGAAIFGLIGIAQVSGRVLSIFDLGPFWPVVIIVLGLILVLTTRRNTRTRC